MEKSNETLNSSLFSRLLKGTSAQAFSQLVQIIIRVSEVPLLLAFWGTQLYGEWLMLSAIPVYLSISDGGFAGAACREMTMRSGAGDRKGALAVYQSTWLFLIFVSAAALLLAYGVLELAPLKKWLGFSVIEPSEIRLVVLLLVVHVLLGFQGGLLNGGFWVSGCYSTGMYLLAFTRLLEFSGLAIAVFVGGGPVKAATGYLIGRVCGTVIMLFGKRNATPWLRHGFIQASFSELRKLTAPALASLAFPLGNALNIQGMRLVVGIALGPSAVAIFSPLRTLSRLVTQPMLVINRLVQPELSLAFGARDTSLFRNIFLKSCQFSFWGCLVTCLFVGPGAHWLFPVWAGGKLPFDWPAYTILLFASLVNSMWYTALMVPYATNRHKGLSVYYIIVYGAVVLFIGYFMTVDLGITGAAIGLLFSECSMALIVVSHSIHLTDTDLSQWLSEVSRPPLEIIRRFPFIFRRLFSGLPKLT